MGSASDKFVRLCDLVLEGILMDRSAVNLGENLRRREGLFSSRDVGAATVR